MLSEQQQRIMGYFIEEAKDHLNTIEQGLLNLQATIADSEMVSEVFRAAHSVKGGAAMLGLDSIQHTSHRLEDYFKVLKECSIQVDQKLETLLLRVFDSLQELLEQLQGPFGLTEDKAAAVMTEVEPVFVQLNQHLSNLVRQSGGTPPEDVQLLPPTAAPIETPAAAFSREVPARLREMLTQFKQADTAATREQLQEICRSLGRLGERFSLAQWSELVALAQQAIASTDNSYRALAPVLIKDIKQAYELILAGRSIEIQPSSDLQGLVPVSAEPDLLDLLSPDEAAMSAPLFDFEPLPDSGDLLPVDEAATDEATLDWFAADDSTNGVADADDFDSLSNSAAQPGPEVGLAELNSLADLFEGELPDLGLSWQEEMVGDEDGAAESLDLDSSSDFSDLLFDQAEPTTIPAEDEDLSGLLNSTDEAKADSELSFDLFAESAAEEAEFDLSELAFTDAIASARPEALGDLNGLFADIEAEVPSSGDAAALDDLFGEDADVLFAAEPEREPTFGDAFAGLDLDADAPAESIDLDDPFALSVNSADSSDADLDIMLNGIDAIDPPELAAADASWQDVELTSDLWDSSLSLEDAPADNAFAVPSEVSVPVEPPADLFAELPDADSVDIEAQSGFDQSSDDSMATDDLLGFDQSPIAESGDDLLNLDQLTSTEEAIADQPFDLNDLWGDSEAPALEPEATGTLDEVIFLPNAGAIDAPLLENASLDALFADESDAAIADDAVLPDLLTPIESAESEASNFDFLLEEPASVAPDLSLEPALPLESNDFDSLESSSDSIDADLLDLMQTDSAANESNLLFEQPDSIDADLFGLTVDNAQSEPFDWLEQSAESASDANFNQTAANNSSDEFDLLKQPESDSITAGSNLTAADSASSGASDDLDLLLEQPEAELEDHLFDLAAADSADSIDADDLFGLAAEDSETPLLDLNESDLSVDELRLDRERLDAIDDRSLEDSLLALDSDVANREVADESGDNLGAADLDLFADIDASFGADEAEQSLADLPLDVEAINPVVPELQADRMADVELELDLDALDLEHAAVSAEELFDLPLADDASIFDLDAIELSAEEIEPFDLDAALMEEAIAPSPDQADALASENLDDRFALEETAPTESIDADANAFDLLLSAEAEMPNLSRTDQDAALEDLDALLMSDAIETPESIEEVSIAPDDFEAAFDSDALPSAETDDLADLLMGLPDEEADFAALLADDSIEEGEIFAEASTESKDFADLEAMLESPFADSASSTDDFADLAALLEPETESAIVSGFSIEQDAISGFAEDVEDEEFASLDALLSDAPAAQTNEFDDLEKLLENADQTLGGSPSERGVRRPSLTPKKRSPGALKDQNMRVSVKNLDNLNNLVGELVVNRNSLEQTQERVRQFLDNLVYQVQQLSDVGQRMRDLYERSLLESSLLSSRRSYQLSQGGAPAPASHSTGMSFDALEMDRFTGFHTLSQEMIELIVRVRESASDIDRMVDESDQITRMFRQVTTQLQEGLTRSRMVPFDQTAARLPRAVRDISLKCGKQAELVVEGKETLIDKMILEQLYDPMTHLVNNAITHGIETPVDRQAAGKPLTGRITIRAFHQGNQTVISVTDDGAGIDPEAVKRKAIEKNLITPAEAREMTRLDVYDLLFLHGFSTRDRADDFAGRGVGMDVVRTSLNEVRGTVNIDSTIGRGTTFTIRLPLTLSISKALCCISNRARIAFPMDGVEDMFDVPREQVQIDSEGRACIQWRDTLLPFQPLADLLRYSRNLGRGSVYGGNQDEDIVSVVVLRSNAGSFLGLQVDQVLGEQEIVIKQLEGPVPKPVGVAGATVLGDGHIMPIADVLELIDLSQGRIRREPGSSLWEKADGQAPIEPPATKVEPTVLIVDDSITVRELLSMTFNKVGYRVEQARDGQEAWEKLRSGLPCDLVFCDIEMPRMDGLELLSRIQKDPNLNHLPIAMLTSRGADRHRQMAVQLGAKGYFTKPYLEESLLDAAGRMLKGEVLVS